MNVSGERTKSLWMQEAAFPKAPSLEENASCDTVVVGAGIAGISVAYELALAGQKVVVVDRGPLFGGMTSRTTAHLAPICDDGLSALIELRGEDLASQFQESQEAAVDRIEEHVETLPIACDYRRLDGLLFPAPGMAREDAEKQCDEEFAAARKAGAAVERIDGLPLKGHENSPGLRYPRQATFHPLKYLDALAADFTSRGGRLFGDSPVTSLEENGEGVRLVTEQGTRISAARAVFATNSPIHRRIELHSKLAPYRTYALALELPKDVLPDALYWDMSDPYYYVRLHPGPGAVDYLIAGGRDHKSGEADDGDDRFVAIEGWIRALVPDLGKVVARWSGQVLETIDYCGFIGRDPENENVFLVTGDSGQGMTHGALAGILLRDLIVAGSSPWEAVYDPSRKTPTGFARYIRENLSAAQNLAEYVTPGELASADELKAGEGGILRSGLSKLAACRDVAGTLHVHSAACTHLGCIVHWNSTEQCWDCPCHGSQFAPDGSVLNGPAIVPLAKKKLA